MDGPAYIDGIDIPLPEDERVLWQGAPSARSLARYAFHMRKVAGYFALLIALRGLASLDEPSPGTFFMAGALPLALLGLLTVALSLGLARLCARTTVYAITDRRVVMKVGMVVSTLVNIPFRQIEGAAVRPLPHGAGDIALTLGGDERLAWIMLWPHARGWRLSHPQPALRSVPEATTVGALLRDAVAVAARPEERLAVATPPVAVRTASRPETARRAVAVR